MSFDLIGGILGLGNQQSQAANLNSVHSSSSCGCSPNAAPADSHSISQFSQAIGHSESSSAGTSLLQGNSGLGGVVNGLLSGITGGKDAGIGGLIGTPLGLFSNLVGHDSAAKAAANGDVQGWLVNTFDHSGHSHPLGGNSGSGSSAPLAILGTLGQEAGGLIGLDKVFGSALEHDARNGTNYVAGGSPSYGLTGGGSAANTGHGGHH
ncbi:MAG: hypothetical protein ACPG51_07715 [Thiolinea sp.]